jgi:hypothetical protein
MGPIPRSHYGPSYSLGPLTKPAVNRSLFISLSSLVGYVEVAQFVGLLVCTLNVQPVTQLLLLQKLLCQVLQVALLE